jgi:hypothetical protein
VARSIANESLTSSIVVLVVLTAWIPLTTGAMSVATIVAAIVAIVLATIIFAAALPNRIGEDLHDLDRRRGIVAFDH